jgi:hypothetical protein
MPLSDLFDPDTDLEPAPFCGLSFSRYILYSMDIGTDGRCIVEDTSDRPQPRQLIAYRSK